MFLLSLIAGLVGCKASVQSRLIAPCSATQPSLDAARGPVYYLPKTMLSVTITLVTEGTQKFTNGVPAKITYGKARVKSVAITPITVADQHRPVEINPKGLTDAAAIEAKVSMSFSDDGRLVGFNTVTSDKSAEAIKETLGAIIGIAKIGVGLFDTAAVPTADPVLEDLQKKVNAAYKELPGATPEDSAKILARIADLNKAIDDVVQRNRTVVSEVTYEYTTLIDPADNEALSFNKAAVPENFVASMNPSLGTIPKDAADRLIELLKESGPISIEVVGAHSAATPPAEDGAWQDGVIVAVPRTLRLLARPKTDSDKLPPVVDILVSLPQFGGRIVVPARSKAFSTSNTTVEFAGTGTPSKLEIDNGSSADKAAKALNENVATLNTAIADIKKATSEDTKLAAETATINAEKGRLDAEKARVDAELALIEARKKLEAAKQPSQTTGPKP